jgi:hypothetical protein
MADGSPWPPVGGLVTWGDSNTPITNEHRSEKLPI